MIAVISSGDLGGSSSAARGVGAAGVGGAGVGAAGVDAGRTAGSDGGPTEGPEEGLASLGDSEDVSASESSLENRPRYGSWSLLICLP